MTVSLITFETTDLIMSGFGLKQTCIYCHSRWIFVLHNKGVETATLSCRTQHHTVQTTICLIQRDDVD